MTYKEIINRFRTITENHLMLEDFGYGDLSDLKYVSQLGTDEERVSYPYLYLLPSSSTRNGVVMNYSFNMIIMDMARPEDGANTDEYDNYITIQSQCQQYIDDVLAQLYYFYKDQPEITLTGITYTPFKEKYQDVVAGMTATITIQVPTPLNECIAPFNNWVLEQDLGFAYGLRDYTSNSAGSRVVCAPYDIPQGPRRYKIEIDAYFKVLYDITQDDDPYNIPVMVLTQDGGEEDPRYLAQIPFNGLSREVQNIRQSFEFTLEDLDPQNNELRVAWGWSTGTPMPDGNIPISEPDAIEGLNGNVSIYILD